MERFQALRDSAYGVTYATELPRSRDATRKRSSSTGAEPGLVDERTPPVDVRRCDRRDGVRRHGTPALTLVDWTATAISICSAVGAGRAAALARTTAGRSPTSRRPRRSRAALPGAGVARRRRRLRQRRHGRPVPAARRRHRAAAPGRRRHVRGRDGGGRHRAGDGGRRAPRRSSTSITTAISTSSSAAGARRISCCATTATARSPTSAAAAGVRGGAGHAVAIVPTDFDNRRDIDLLRGRSRTARPRSSGTCATARSRTWRRTAGCTPARRLDRGRRRRRQQGRLHRLLLRPRRQARRASR